MDFNSMNPRQKEKKGWGGFFLGVLAGSVVSLLLAAVLYATLAPKDTKEVKEEKEKKETKQTVEVVSVYDDEMADKVEMLEELIYEYYYKDDIDQAAMQDGMYKGMVDSLGDPYSVYYTEAELEALLEQTSGIYYGIGAYVGLDTVTGYPKIISPIEGAPAEEAGLRPDDIIYEVDGVSTHGKDINNVVALIKGEEGTKVTLTIVRSGESDYLYIDVERRLVETPSVESEMFENGMAYIQITEFADTTVEQFAEALETAEASGMKGLILDLRANPGGSLSAVVDIARMLLPKGLVVYTEDKYGDRQEFTCNGKHEFKLPMVVLVDGNSASASEVLAGAIKDYELGTLVGTTTYGKGIVQQIISLDDGTAIKVTVSSYYSPKGINIHGTGIEPDLVCEFDAEAYYGEEQFDNQLEYAKEVLAELIH